MEEKKCNEIDQWRFRYRNKKGLWQGWSVSDGFEEAKDLAEYHARGREFEILRVVDTEVKINDFSLEEKMQEHGLTDSDIAKSLQIGQSVLTQARKRGRFSAPLKAALSLYFQILESKK